MKKLRKKRGILKNPWFWIILLFLTFGGLFFYAVFFWGKIQISKVEVLGANRVQPPDIESVVLKSIDKKMISAGLLNVSSKSFFIADAKKISEGILSNFPDVENADVFKKFPNGISLTIKEREPFAVFLGSEEKYFLMDRNGVIFNELEKAPDDMALIRGGDYNNKKSLGQEVVSKKTAEMIYKVENSLKDNFQVEVLEIEADDIIMFKTSENWRIYLDPNSDAELQIAKMNSLLNDEIKPEKRKKLEYIYLQYGARAYYK
mgnify:CR=1 FL=1